MNNQWLTTRYITITAQDTNADVFLNDMLALQARMELRPNTGWVCNVAKLKVANDDPDYIGPFDTPEDAEVAVHDAAERYLSALSDKNVRLREDAMARGGVRRAADASEPDI